MSLSSMFVERTMSVEGKWLNEFHKSLPMSQICHYFVISSLSQFQSRVVNIEGLSRESEEELEEIFRIIQASKKYVTDILIVVTCSSSADVGRARCLLSCRDN